MSEIVSVRVIIAQRSRIGGYNSSSIERLAKYIIAQRSRIGDYN